MVMGIQIPPIPMHNAKMKRKIKTIFYETDGTKQNGPVARH
jgi:hypothetical protein